MSTRGVKRTAFGQPKPGPSDPRVSETSTAAPKVIPKACPEVPPSATAAPAPKPSRKPARKPARKPVRKPVRKPAPSKPAPTAASKPASGARTSTRRTAGKMDTTNNKKIFGCRYNSSEDYEAYIGRLDWYCQRDSMADLVEATPHKYYNDRSIGGHFAIHSRFHAPRLSGDPKKIPKVLINPVRVPGPPLIEAPTAAEEEVLYQQSCERATATFLAAAKCLLYDIEDGVEGEENEEDDEKMHKLENEERRNARE